MEKWLVGRGAATSGVSRVFDHEAPIAVVYYLRDRVRFKKLADPVTGPDEIRTEYSVVS
jgi:hypothetical protein